VSPIFGKGTAHFSKGDQSGKIKAKAEGTIPVINGKSCYFCLETIQIEADTKVPLIPFFSEVSSQGNSITLKNFNIAGPSEPEGATKFIVAGPEGATLKKKGKGFILLGGKAYLLDTASKPATATSNGRGGEWRGSADCGDLCFTVNDSGDSISRIEFTKLKGIRKTYSLEASEKGWDIGSDGKFDIRLLKILDNITFKGRFDPEGKQVTGTRKMPSGCSCKWKATKEP
jgi:hypothetical protein